MDNSTWARGALFAVLLVSWVGASGACAHLPPSFSEKSEPREELTAIVPAQYLPELHLDAGGWPPGDARKLGRGLLGAGVGLIKGADFCFQALPGGLSAMESGNPVGAVVGVIILAAEVGCLCVAAPIGMLVGLVGGAASVPSRVRHPTAEEVDQAQARLQHAVAEMKLPLALAERLLGLGAERTARRLVLRPADGPASAQQPVDYRTLADGDGQGVAEVVELRVQEISLSRPEGGGTAGGLSLRLDLLARARVLRTATNETVREESFPYHGEVRPFYSWASEDSQLLAVELDIGLQRIAEAVAEKLLAVPDATR